MISANRVREAFTFDPLTGVFCWAKKISRTVVVGKVAGAAVDSDGYHVLQIDGRSYKAHRVAWLYVHGYWPTMEIDHVNGDRADNRIANLREATRSQNRGNSKRHKDNKSGFKGVRLQKHTKRNPWRAQINIGGRSVHLGNFPTPELAHEAYVDAATRHFGEFARAA